MSYIVISGATSFIGLKLTQYLLVQGHSVAAVVRERAEKAVLLPSSQRLRTIELNCEQYFELGQIVGRPIDCFVHLAWNGTRGAMRDDAELQENNYRYSLDAVKSVLESGCKKVVSAGSQAEYGICTNVVTEEHPCSPVTKYGKWKLKFFEDASVLCRDKGSVMIEPRFFSLYGPNDFEGTMIISILKKMLFGEPCDLTQGIQMWDFLHVEDAAAGIAALIEQDVPAGVYNFGSGDARMLKDYIDEMRRFANSGSLLNYGAVPYPKTGMVTIQPDATKLKATTGWNPNITFEQGINGIIDGIKAGMK